MRSMARLRDSTSEASSPARSGLPDRKAFQNWLRNSVEVACVRDRRSNSVDDRPHVPESEVTSACARRSRMIANMSLEAFCMLTFDPTTLMALVSSSSSSSSSSGSTIFPRWNDPSAGKVWLRSVCKDTIISFGSRCANNASFFSCASFSLSCPKNRLWSRIFRTTRLCSSSPLRSRNSS